jgi:hypothetical protein
MDPLVLQDRIYRSLNTAARTVGINTDAYRPSGQSDPLAQPNRYLHLNAAFTTHDGKFAHPNGYGEALWYGIFDAAYTRPGDYLVQNGTVWFIASQQRLLPTPLLTNWPASVLGASGRGHPTSDLPGDTAIPYSTVLMPEYPNVVLHPSDLMTDDLGRNAVVAAAELTELGWRIAVKQATT